MSANSKRAVTVETLIDSSIGNKDLADFIRDQCNIIDEKIVEEHNKSRLIDDENLYIYSLPTVFDIEGVTRPVARLTVYSSIITYLNEGGFKVNISETKNGSVLIIRWPSVLMTDGIKTMRNIISHATLKIEEVRELHKKFMARQDAI